MSKNVFKEIIIALLLCLAIILVLALVLYNYVPTTKTLPEMVSYSTPSKVSQELASASGAEEDQIITTYEVDSTDMNNYENTNSYNPGKSNPFTRFQELQDGTIVTNPKQTTIYTAPDGSISGSTSGGTSQGSSSSSGASGTTAGSSSNGNSGSSGSSASGGSSSSAGASSAGTGSTGASASGSSSGAQNGKTNNGGEPGYYNYKNGK